MVESLFREEAVNFAGQRSFGGVMIKQPLSLQALTLIILAITIAVILFLQTKEYARKVTVKGYVQPELGVSYVYASKGGVIEQVLVKEGRLVEKNQILAQIKSSHSLINGSESYRAILVELHRQKSQLQEAVVREEENYALENVWRRKQLKSLAEEQVQIETMLALQLSRTNLSEKELSNAKSLKISGYLSNVAFFQHEAAFLAEQKELALIHQRETRLNTESTTAKHHLRMLPNAYQNRVEELYRRLSDLNQKIVEINGRSASLIRAPISGQVTRIAINRGDKIKDSFPILTIIPQHAELFAYLQIPSRAAGFIKRGQSVRLMFDSFPYQQFGTQAGTVVSISDTSQRVKEYSGAPLASEAVYLAKVKLEKSSITAYGKEQKLKVGMLLNADIVHSKRSIFDWIAEPLYTLRGRTQ